MKYINFEENRKIGQKVSLKKSDVIGYKKNSKNTIKQNIFGKNVTGKM